MRLKKNELTRKQDQETETVDERARILEILRAVFSQQVQMKMTKNHKSS